MRPSIRDALSTKNRFDSDIDTACDASPGSSSLTRRAVVADTIEVRIVRILAAFPADRRNVRDAGLVVDALDAHRDELARRQRFLSAPMLAS